MKIRKLKRGDVIIVGKRYSREHFEKYRLSIFRDDFGREWCTVEKITKVS